MKFSNATFILLSLTIVLSGCGKKDHLDLGQFSPYVDQFKADAAVQGQTLAVKDLVIKFGPMQNSQERGICVTDGDATPVIMINQDAWDQMTEDEREPLIFHELGHCLLHRSHKSDVLARGVPESLMNPYTIPGNTYASYKEHYVEELFSANNTH